MKGFTFRLAAAFFLTIGMMLYICGIILMAFCFALIPVIWLLSKAGFRWAVCNKKECRLGDVIKMTFTE